MRNHVGQELLESGGPGRTQDPGRGRSICSQYDPAPNPILHCHDRSPPAGNISSGVKPVAAKNFWILADKRKITIRKKSWIEISDENAAVLNNEVYNIVMNNKT